MKKSFFRLLLIITIGMIYLSNEKSQNLLVYAYSDQSDMSSMARGYNGNKPAIGKKLDIVVEEDLVYGIGGDVELKLDLARPPSGEGPFPALVFLFGGGYKLGSKSTWYTTIREAAKRGYVAVAIDYRLTSVMENGVPKYQFPSQVHDGKCSIRWLRVNASTYKININWIGVVGFSAGANLALMIGLTDLSDGLEGDCGNGSFSSRVQFVVNLAGATDLVIHYQLYPNFYGDLLGSTPEQMPERYQAASPIFYVSEDDPPVLTLCGSEDPVLPQEVMLDSSMMDVGAFHTLIVMDSIGHSRLGLVNFAENNPVWEFLNTPVVVDEEILDAPLEFRLFQNYPNPFNPITTIQYQMFKAGRLTLKIYNLMGQEIITLAEKKKESGKYKIEWNGLNSDGHAVGAGLYIVRMLTGKYTASKKILLLR